LNLFAESGSLRGWLLQLRTNGNTQPVGAGLPAKAFPMLTHDWRPPSLASQLLQGSSVQAKTLYATKNCGSGLAREGCITFNISVD